MELREIGWTVTPLREGGRMASLGDVVMDFGLECKMDSLVEHPL